MSVLGPRVQSRSATLLIVLVAHGLLLWCIWRVRTPVSAEVETFVSMLSFVTQTPSQGMTASIPPATGRSAATHQRAAGPSRQPLLLPSAPPPQAAATIITLPTAPRIRIDWTAQLQGAARTELDQEETARKQLRALTRRYEVDPDPRNPGLAPSRSYRWYEAGIHRIDTRGQLPVLVLNDRCVMLMFILPFCRIGHIEIHGDLFDGAAAVHDARLSTPGPNEVP
jgi:hypothetical protein